MKLHSEEISLIEQAVAEKMRQDWSARHCWKHSISVIGIEIVARPEYTARQYAALRAAVAMLRRLREEKPKAWRREAMDSYRAAAAA